MQDGKQLPEPWEWSHPERVSGGPYYPQTVFYHDQYFRPLEGGDVKMVSPAGVVVYRGRLAGLPQSWGIYLAPGGPVGFGDGGVYGLDANLAISSKLIELGPGDPIAPNVPPRPRRASGIAGDGKTFVVVASLLDAVDAKGLRSDVEAWTADGRRKLRSEPVYGINDWLPQERIVPVDGGYLVATYELLWVPSSTGEGGKDPAAWRFCPSGAVPGFQNLRFLTAPVVNNGYVFTASRDGNLYVFDQSKITGAPPPARRTKPAGPKFIDRGIVITKRP